MRLAIELGGALVAAIAAYVAVRWILGRGRLGDTLDARSRATISKSFAILVFVIVAVLVLSGRNELIRTQLLVGTVEFMPKLVVGAIVFIVAFVLSKLAGVIVEQAMRSRSPVLATRARSAVSASIVVIGLLITLKQMGLETDVLMIILAGIVAITVLAFGLGMGLGAQPLARQIAAGRHVEDRFRIGQHVGVGGTSGRITSMNLASVRITDGAGRSWEVPNTAFLEEPVEVSED